MEGYNRIATRKHASDVVGRDGWDAAREQNPSRGGFNYAGS